MLHIYIYDISHLRVKIAGIYEVMWKNVVEQGRPQMTVWWMHIACWIIKATHILMLCNTDCFSTATIIARTSFIVNVYTYIAQLLTQYMHLLVTHAAGLVSAYAVLVYIASCYTLSCISFNLFLGLFV